MYIVRLYYIRLYLPKNGQNLKRCAVFENMYENIFDFFPLECSETYAKIFTSKLEHKKNVLQRL